MNKDNYLENIKRNLKVLDMDDFKLVSMVINSIYRKHKLSKNKADEN